jgi:hypothetical protein
MLVGSAPPFAETAVDISRGRRQERDRNGTWSTPSRGTVYIHASSKFDCAALDWLRDHAHVTPPADFVHGAVVAVVEIVDVLTNPRRRHSPRGSSGRTVSPSPTSGRFGRPCRKGRLGLARASDDLRRRVARALRSSELYRTRPASSCIRSDGAPGSGTGCS